MTNVGVIGLGKMGILHSGIMNSLPDARVKAICEKERFLVRAAKAVLPRTMSFYNDHLKMLENEELDAIFITTPIGTHVPLVADLAHANRDVSIFVEKPLAASYDQARVACDAVRNLRGVHMVGFQKRFSVIFQKARSLIKDGLLGEPIFFRAYSFSSDVLREGSSWRFRKGTGGVLLDLAPHLLDMLLWFFGEPSSIESVRRRVHSKEVDDYAHAVLSFESGLKGHMDACWSIRNFRLPEISIEIYCRNGMLAVTDDFVKLLLDREGSPQVYYRQSFDTSVPFLLADPEYTKEDEAFLSAVQKRTMPDSNFLEAARVNAIIDRISEDTRPHGVDSR